MFNLGSETETLEFKRSTGELKEAVVSIVAILNKHQKGEVYFGVKNDGTPIGQEVSDKSLRDVADEIYNHIEPRIFPTIDIVTIDWKKCIYVSFEGHNTPYLAYNIARIRIADEDRIMSQEELKNYLDKNNNYEYAWENFDSKISLNDINDNELRNYVEKAHNSNRISFLYTNKRDVLKSLSLIKGDVVLNAAMVLFSKSIYTELQMAVFAGNEKLTFLDIQREQNNIFSLVSSAENYIFRNTRTRVKMDGSLERKEIHEFPEDAVREALINSFCHKDYGSCQNNEVLIFQDRVEIYNPGKFPDGLTPDDFISGKESSRLRNPLIARTLYYSKNIESFGTGLKRIKESCEKMGVKYEFMNTRSGFRVIFYRNSLDSLTKDVATEAKNIDSNVNEIGIQHHKRGGVGRDEISSYCKSPKSKEDIMKHFGFKSGPTFSRNYLSPLLKEGKLRMVSLNIKDKNQKYIATT